MIIKVSARVLDKKNKKVKKATQKIEKKALGFGVGA